MRALVGEQERGGMFAPEQDVVSSYFTVAETPTNAMTYGGSQMMSLMSSSKK